MIIDIETVVFRDAVVQIGVLPEKLISRARDSDAVAKLGTGEDGWIITLDTDANELTMVSDKGEPICVPVANVRCYTRRKVASPATDGTAAKIAADIAAKTAVFVAPKNTDAVLPDNKAANARGKR